jgi:hypothetical protein
MAGITVLVVAGIAITLFLSLLVAMLAGKFLAFCGRDDHS